VIVWYDNGSGADAVPLPFSTHWVRTRAPAAFLPEAPHVAREGSMDFVKRGCFGSGPLLDQSGVLFILGALFLLFVWRAFRSPSTPAWWLIQRPK
jgi:hypothetical protein